jgi:hypothetical protein
MGQPGDPRHEDLDELAARIGVTAFRCDDESLFLPRGERYGAADRIW